MSNRYAEKIKRRREKLKENKPLTYSSAPNEIWFWLYLIPIILVIGYLSYRTYSSNLTNVFIIPVVVVILLLSALTIWYLPKFYVQSLPNEAGKTFDRENAKLKLEDDARKTFAQIVGGAVLLGGLIFTYNTFRLQQDTYQLQQEGQFTDRFTKAVTQIGDDKLEVRLGGLYALERIAKDSPKDHWTVMEVISAYVREKAKKNSESSENANSSSNKSEIDKTNETKINKRISTDIQVALTIIGRRKVEQDSKNDRIDLSGADLSGADLLNLNLSNAILHNVNLSKANLTRTNLRQSLLLNTDLSFSTIYETDLSKTDLMGVNLSQVQLVNVNLSGTNLIGTKQKLEFENLNKSIIDENTLLPEHLQGRRKELIEASKDSDNQRAVKIILEDGFIKDEGKLP